VGDLPGGDDEGAGVGGIVGETIGTGGGVLDLVGLLEAGAGEASWAKLSEEECSI